MKSLFSKAVIVFMSLAAVLDAGHRRSADAAEPKKEIDLSHQVEASLARYRDDIEHRRERGLILMTVDDLVIPVARSSLQDWLAIRILGGDDPDKVIAELRDLMSRQEELAKEALSHVEHVRETPSAAMWIAAMSAIMTFDAVSLSIAEASVEPAEIEPGKSVRLRAVYWARRIANTGVKIQEKITITGPGTAPVVSSAERSLTEFQHGDGGAGTMDGACRPELEIVAKTPGKYTCQIEISASGAQTVTRTVSFTVKGPLNADAITVTPGRGNAVWRRSEAQVDPRLNFDKPFVYEGVNCGFDQQKMTATSFSAAVRRTGKDGKPYREINWNIKFGSPPSELRAGQVVEISASGSAGGNLWDQQFMWHGGDWKINEGGKWEVVHTSIAAPDIPRGFGVGKWSSTTEVRQADARFRLTVPDNPPDKFSVYFSMPNVGSAVYTYEKQRDGAGPVVGGAGQGGAGPGTGEPPQPPVIRNVAGGGGQATDPVGGLSARLQSETITIRAGEVSVPCGIYVSGWRGNSSDRVEVVIGTQGLSGALEINPSIVVFPGSTSEATGNMDRKEYYFSEFWRGAPNAPEGTTLVPIIVRQRGAGQVRLTLRVNVIPRTLPGTAATRGGATQGGGGAAGGGGNVSIGGARTVRPAEDERVGVTRGEGRPGDPDRPGRPGRVISDVSGRTAMVRVGENASVTQRLFAAESVWLARLGGYSDAGSNSTDEQDHLRWADGKSDERVGQGLVEKFLTQFDRQAANGHESACRFYAAASARLAGYGVDLGDPGSNSEDQESHLRWARDQTAAKLREAMAEKLRALLRGVQRESIRR